MFNYDLYYAPFEHLLDEQYDFITMTEVIEHIAHPAKLLTSLDKMLKPGAVLAVMTKRLFNQQRFVNWHYKNDPTHISFYSIETFKWIANKMDWRLEVINDDVIFLFKSS